MVMILYVSKPLQVKYIPQFTSIGLKDYVALIKWSPYTSDPVITIPKDKIMSIVNASGEMTRSYEHVIKGYEKQEPLAKRQKPMNFKRERLSDSDNDRINEIFEEFEDDDYITKKTIH